MFRSDIPHKFAVSAKLAFHRVDAAQQVGATPARPVEENGAFRRRSSGGQVSRSAGSCLMTFRRQAPLIGAEGIAPSPHLPPGRYAAPSTTPIRAVVASAAAHLPPFELICLCTRALRRQSSL